MPPRYFPPRSRATRSRSQQRFGSGSKSTWTSSSNDGGGSIEIGVSNVGAGYQPFGYIGFRGGDTAFGKGYMWSVDGTDTNYGPYTELQMSGGTGVVDGHTGMTKFREYNNTASDPAYNVSRTWSTHGVSYNGIWPQAGIKATRDTSGGFTNYYGNHYWYTASSTSDGSVTELMRLTTSSGNLQIQGSLSKGSGSFDIPHPVVEGKRLRHSFIEGPYADLIYRGTVTLGAEPVTICMDEQYGMTEGTWKALNTNPWSIVSASGKLVEWSLNECELTITGDEGTVCQWMVIGERKDPHMIDTNISDNDGRIVLEYTPTAEPEDIHEQPTTPHDG